MSNIKSKKVKLFYGALILLLVIIFVSSALLLINYWDKNSGIFPESSDIFVDTVKVDGKVYVRNENIQSLLILGLDKYENDIDNSGFYNDQQADFLVLFVLDNESKTYKAIHLNRDTMTDINVLGVAGEKIDTINAQLALAHTYGNGKEVSCRNTADAVSGLLNNVNINKYISVTMDSVPVITDLVGGVEVTVEDDFSDIDSSLVQGETVKLNGQQALTFVRSRYGLGDGTNASRMKRQQEFMFSLFNTFGEKVKEDEDFALKASMELSDCFVSNYSLDQLENMITTLSEYEFEGIYEIEGESKAGEKFMEFYADKSSIDQLVLDLFYTEKR